MNDLFWSAAKKIESLARYTVRGASADSVTQNTLRFRFKDAFGFNSGSSCSALIRFAGISGAVAVAISAYSSHGIF